MTMLLVIAALAASVVASMAVIAWQRTHYRAMRDELMLQLAGAKNRAEDTRRQLELISNLDPSTGLLRRHVLEERFQFNAKLSKRYDRVFGLILLQLTGVESVRQTHGDEVADRLLSAASRRLLTVTRESDTVGRLGENVFAVLLPMLHGPEDIGTVAAKLRGSMEHVFKLAGIDETFLLIAQMGAASYPAHGQTWPALLKTAGDQLPQARSLIAA